MYGKFDCTCGKLILKAVVLFYHCREKANESEPKPRLFIWKDNHEKLLVEEVLATEPYQYKIGSKERGAAWTQLAERLSASGLRVTQRSVREKFDRLLKDFNRKKAEEKRPSGVDVEYGELERGLLDIKERMAELEEQRENEDQKQKKDKASAEEMRRQATENLSETKKRRTTAGESDSDNGEPAASNGKRKCNNSSMVDVVRESIQLKKVEQVQNEEMTKREMDARATELQQQRMFQQSLLHQQQQFQQQQQAFNLQMIGALGELLKCIKK